MAAPLSLEICAGAGGQALDLEAGFKHAALVEIWECVSTAGGGSSGKEDFLGALGFPRLPSSLKNNRTIENASETVLHTG